MLPLAVELSIVAPLPLPVELIPVARVDGDMGWLEEEERVSKCNPRNEGAGGEGGGRWS